MKRAAATLALLIAAASATATPAVVQPPRWYGHFVGDVLQQRIALQGAELATLPEPARVDAWFERRAARLEQGALLLDYQLVNSPAQAQRVSLPALRLATRQGALLEVPAWPVSIAPLAVDDRAAPAPLQPLRRAPLPNEATPLQRLRLAAGLLGATLLLWTALTALLRWRDARRRPFARAARELKHLPADAPPAWQALHRAFDHCAGRSLQRGGLAPLFTAAPWLLPLQPDIERFYAASAALFYGGTAPPDAPLPHALARRLLRLERRHT
jgi:mxaA protein